MPTYILKTKNWRKRESLPSQSLHILLSMDILLMGVTVNREEAQGG